MSGKIYVNTLCSLSIVILIAIGALVIVRKCDRPDSSSSTSTTLPQTNVRPTAEFRQLPAEHPWWQQSTPAINLAIDKYIINQDGSCDICVRIANATTKKIVILRSEIAAMINACDNDHVAFRRVSANDIPTIEPRLISADIVSIDAGDVSDQLVLRIWNRRVDLAAATEKIINNSNLSQDVKISGAGEIFFGYYENETSPSYYRLLLRVESTAPIKVSDR